MGGKGSSGGVSGLNSMTYNPNFVAPAGSVPSQFPQERPTQRAAAPLRSRGGDADTGVGKEAVGYGKSIDVSGLGFDPATVGGVLGTTVGLATGIPGLGVVGSAIGGAFESDEPGGTKGMTPEDVGIGRGPSVESGYSPSGGLMDSSEDEDEDEDESFGGGLGGQGDEAGEYGGR